METSTNKFKIIHKTLQKADNRLSVKMLCEIAGVSRSGYYNWVHSAEKRAEKEARDRADFERILEAYNFRGESLLIKSQVFFEDNFKNLI